MRLPTETLIDIFHHLDRSDLDSLQSCYWPFHRVVHEQMPRVCLRQIKEVKLRHAAQNGLKMLAVCENGRWVALVEDEDDGGQYLMNIMRASRIQTFTAFVTNFPMRFEKLLLDEGCNVQIESIELRSIDLSTDPNNALYPSHFHKSLLSLWRISSLNIFLGTRLPYWLICDEFLRDCSKKGVRQLCFPLQPPVDEEYYAATEEGILDFCFKGETKDGQTSTSLEIGYAVTSSIFIHQIIERSKTSHRTDDLYLKLSPIKSEEQELTRYKQFLRRNYATTVYDFPGEMHLQVVFYERSNYVVVYRGKNRKDGTFLEF